MSKPIGQIAIHPTLGTILFVDVMTFRHLLRPCKYGYRHNAFDLFELATNVATMSDTLWFAHDYDRPEIERHIRLLGGIDG